MNRRAPIIAGAVIAVVALLAVVVLVLPKMAEVGETRDELAAAQDEEITLEVQLRALQDAEAAAPETQRQIDLIEDQVPSTADLPALIRLLQGAADRAAVDFFTFAPGTPLADASGAFSTIPSLITATGSYFQLDEFLLLVETLPRAAKVTSMSMAPAEGEGTGLGSPNLQLQVTIEFYTTDVSAGPGSQPGPTEGAAPAGATGPTGDETEGTA